MRFSALLFSAVSGLLLGDSAVEASFHRDVISQAAKKGGRPLPFISGKPGNKVDVEEELLAKAIPLSEYHEQLKSLGVDLPSAASEGANGGATRRMEDGDDADDYYMNEAYMYSFSGYSMKYARCQPVQQFSEDALLAGEYSPMVTQDVVILRLCPYKSCSSSRQYGCHYNYAEYAIGLNDYMRVMLRFRADKKERLCEFCAACNGDGDDDNERRKLEEDNQDEEQEDENEEGNDDNQDDAEEANGDDNADNYYYDEDDECYVYSSYCENYYDDCVDADEEENENQDDYNYNQQQVTYLDEDEYYDFLGCTELADSYGAMYFVRPACGSSDTKIAMSVYYDEYCSQAASSVVTMDNFEIAFDDDVFAEMYDGSCMDCSESNYPPSFNANSYMCNKIHYAGASCTSNMVYDLFDGQSSTSSASTECSFIESIRFGTYDSNGEIAVEAAEDAEEVVTNLQKVGLVMSAIICATFVVYACYLHHSMTNLLIKSLSHRELLPPSRHNKRRTPSVNSRRRGRSKGSKGSRRGDDEQDDDEWDRSKPLRSPV